MVPSGSLWSSVRIIRARWGVSWVQFGSVELSGYHLWSVGFSGCQCESVHNVYTPKKNNDLSVKKVFIEIRLRNRMTYVFKGHFNIVETYMVKF